MKPLENENHELFCHEYLKDLNGTKAYRRAYGKGTDDLSAQASSCRLLSEVKVMERIAFLNADRLNRLQINTDFVLTELFKIAMSDVGEMFDVDGKILPVPYMPDSIRRSIQSFEVTEYMEGFGKDREQVGWTTKVKLWSKDKALENLGKYLKRFTDKLDLTLKNSLEDILSEAMKKRIEERKEAHGKSDKH